MLSFKKNELLDKCRIYEINTENISIKQYLLSECDRDELPSDGSCIILRVVSVDLKEEYRKIDANCYEGGYALWESSWILLAFLDNLKSHDVGYAIELGCGHGLCGIYAIMKGYNVLFQDLNSEVFDKCLIPNYILNFYVDNIRDDDVLMKLIPEFDFINNGYRSYIGLECTTNDNNGVYNMNFNDKFEILSTSWDMMYNDDNLIKDRINNCNLILASECIYRSDNFKSIVLLLLKYLKVNYGVAYIATKRFYFGLSGGSFQFLDYVNTTYDFDDTYKLHSKIASSIKPSTSVNIIDILEIRKLFK